MHNSSFDDDRLIDELMTFILQGAGSNCSLVVWVLYSLMENPDAMNQLMNEINANNDVNESLNVSTKTRPVLDACINETLRLFPSSPVILRQCEQTVCIDDSNGRTLSIPRGAIIVMNLFVIQRSPEIWVKMQSNFN